MDPQLLRGAFRIGSLILLVALVTLPFQPSGSAELVVTVMAIVVSGAFVAGVAIMARIAEPSIPDDKEKQRRYNSRSRG